MKKLHLRVAAVILFSSFAATSGSFASTRDMSVVATIVDEQTLTPLNRAERAVASFEMCVDDGSGGDGNQDPYACPSMSALATLQQCESACKAGIVAIEAFCRVIPDPRVKAACILARVSTPACLGFCAWYFK